MTKKLIRFTFHLNLDKQQALKWPKASIRQVAEAYENLLRLWIYSQVDRKSKNEKVTYTLNIYGKYFKYEPSTTGRIK